MGRAVTVQKDKVITVDKQHTPQRKVGKDWRVGVHTRGMQR